MTNQYLVKTRNYAGRKTFGLVYLDKGSVWKFSVQIYNGFDSITGMELKLVQRCVQQYDHKSP